MVSMNILSCKNRNEWRNWLFTNFKLEKEIWLSFPLSSYKEESVSYNDAVEEALCVGWIDGIAKSLDKNHQIRRFTPRRKGSEYSRLNIERLIYLNDEGLIHPELVPSVKKVINKPFKYPTRIINTLKKEEVVWNNYSSFPETYKRIRIAYIDASKDNPKEYKKRLKNFIDKTRENKIISGYGGVDKYYR